MSDKVYELEVGGKKIRKEQRSFDMVARWMFDKEQRTATGRDGLEYDLTIETYDRNYITVPGYREMSRSQRPEPQIFTKLVLRCKQYGRPGLPGVVACVEIAGQ